MKKLIMVGVISLFCISCSSVSKTNRLERGMSKSQVIDILGEPDSSQFVEGYLVWKYSLFQTWKGHIPHYFFFDGRGNLHSWYQNLEEHRENLKKWDGVAEVLKNQNGGDRQKVDLYIHKDPCDSLSGGFIPVNCSK